MNIRKLTSTLAELEKTKSQAKIQAIRSIVGHLSDILWEERSLKFEDCLYNSLFLNGVRRAKRKKK